MLIAQLTDTHVMLPGTSRFFMGDTFAHLRRAVAFINRLAPAPDAAVVTGDLADTGNPQEYERVRAALLALRCPAYVIPGNHDRRSALRAAFEPDGYLPRGDGPLHYAVDRFPVRIVGFDSIRPGFSGGAASGESLAWLEATLASEAERPTLLCMHHPPFRTGMHYMDALGFVGLSNLGAVLARNRHVRLIVSGHVHRTVRSECGGIPARTARSTAPQVVPELFERRPFWIRRERPSVTLHAWDSAAGGFVSRDLTVERR